MRRAGKVSPEKLDAEIIARLSESTSKAYVAAGRLGRQKTELGNALARLVSWVEQDATDDLLRAMYKDVETRGLTDIQYGRELIAAARAALKSGGWQ